MIENNAPSTEYYSSHEDPPFLTKKVEKLEKEKLQKNNDSDDIGS